MIQIICDAILFDLDGVLIDSGSCVIRHWEDWTRQHGIEMAAVMRTAHGVRTVETIRIVAPHLDAEKEAERFKAVEVADTEGVAAIDGALALLEALPSDAWAIVTSGSRELALARLRTAGLPVPGILVSGDDVKQGKPSPEPYLVGASRLGRQSHKCLVLEDAPAGIEAARAAGMQVVGIATTHFQEELDCSVVVDRLSALHIQVMERRNNRLLVQIFTPDTNA
jgi:sugar-phosphatase